MNPEEYARLSEVEQRHWFYRGKREVVRYWLRKLGPVQKDQLLVDCGAGTGLFAREMSPLCRVLAVDDHAESLDLAVRNLGAERVRQGSCTSLPIEDSSADFLTALDVLEHVENDRAAVGEFARVLKPGGIAVITVPALAKLWSDWDVALQHFRRYDRASLLRVLAHRQLNIVHWSYINVVALPAIWLVRKLRSRSCNPTRLEDRIPPEPLNGALRAAFCILACQGIVKIPMGAGLLAVVSKN